MDQGLSRFCLLSSIIHSQKVSPIPPNKTAKNGSLGSAPRLAKPVSGDVDWEFMLPASLRGILMRSRA